MDGLEVYGRSLTHSFLTKALRLYEPNGDMVGTKIFKTGAPEKVPGQTVGIDIEYMPRYMAHFRRRGRAAAKNRMTTVKHIDVTLPLIKERTDIPAGVLQVLRQPGQEHKAWGEAKVRTEQAALNAIIENTREKMRWDLLQTGIVAHTATDVDDMGFSIDFGISGTHTPTLLTTAKWSAPTTCDPIGDIKGWKATYAHDAGVPARFGIMTSDVMNYIINATGVQTFLGDRMKDEIFTLGYVGKMVDLQLIVYDGGYVPDGGSFTNYLGTDKFVLWSGNMFPEYEGIFDDLDATTPGKFSKSFKSDDPSTLALLAGVCSLPSAERINEFFCADVA